MLEIKPRVVLATTILAYMRDAGADPRRRLDLAGATCAAAALTALTWGLSAASAEHTGIASGLNSAVARTGGLIATAFVSVVLTAHGSALLSYFRVAVVVGAFAAAASGISAFAWVRGRNITQ